MAMAMAGSAMPLPAAAPSQENSVTSSNQVRKYFPETWIWKCSSSGLVITKWSFANDIYTIALCCFLLNVNHRFYM